MVENMIGDFTDMLNELHKADVKAKFIANRKLWAKIKKLEYCLMLTTEKWDMANTDLANACEIAGKAMTDFANAIKTVSNHP
jgi:hypothetical protein